MSAASPVDIRVNPNNTAQQYVLWGNGRIQESGGAVPITDQATWYDRIDMPVAVALHISNWATGAGYLLTANGSVHEFNGAPDIGNGILEGVPYFSGRKQYIDWAWNTNGSASGYVLDIYGRIFPFGGATPSSRGTNYRWTWPAARKLKVQFTPSLRAITMDLYGGLHGDFNQGNPITPGGYWRGSDNSRDFVVTSWAATPAGYQLDLHGGVHEFGGAPDPGRFPYRPGADVARLLYILSPTDPVQLGEIWSGGQRWEFTSSTPPSVSAGGGSSESQTVTITGSPTAGTFTLTYAGQTTATIVRTATATAVQTALRALSNIGSTGVNVTGGPGPGTPWVVTFAGSLANTDVAQMTAAHTFTGGTSPAIAVTTTSPGEAASPPVSVTTTTRPLLTWSYTDPQNDSQDGWELGVWTQAFVNANNMADPSVHQASALVWETGINPTTRGIESPVHLPNSALRMYVRAKDTAGQWSAWSNHGWTQAVPLPATPTGLTATANQSTNIVALSASFTTGGSANLVRFEYSDDNQVTWYPVRGTEATTLTATTTGTDRDAPLGLDRKYRALAYATDPAVQSNPSNVATAKLTNLVHLLQTTTLPQLGGQVKVQKIDWSRPIEAGVFYTLGDKHPTVIKDGVGPKAVRGALHLMTMDTAAWALVKSVAESGATLVYRDPFGQVMYLDLVGDWGRDQIRAAPTGTESTPLRHLHTTILPFVEVLPPHLDGV